VAAALVAEDWLDSTDGVICNRIDIDERGDRVAASQCLSVRTDVSTAGEMGDEDEQCNSWMSASSTGFAPVGLVKYVDHNWTYAAGYQCSTYSRLYCFQIGVDRGIRGEHEAAFDGCVDNRYLIIGRWHLSFDNAQDRPSDVSGRVFLRLERVGEPVNALCSANGEDWFTVGRAGVPIEDPIQIRLVAIRVIDLAFYHGAYAEGTAIRSESFTLWG
jgi:hypothetical protein